MQTIALIPAYCPGDRMIKLLTELKELGFAVIVIDDGSGEEYDAVFNQARSYADVQRYMPNKGKGEALKYGMVYIKEHFQPPYTVVTADSDGQHRTEDIVKVSKVACDHPDSLVLGKRTLSKSSPILSRLGNGTTRLFYRLSTGRNIYETQTGLRAFSDRILPRFLRLPGHRYEYEIQMMLCASDLDIIETDIQTIYFDNNAATHFRPCKDTISLNLQFLYYRIPTLITGAVGYALFVVLALLSHTWLYPAIISRVFTELIKYPINRAVFFAEKATLPRALFTSLITLAFDIAFIYGFVLIGVNCCVAKLLSMILLIGVSILVRKLFMRFIYHR